MSPSLRALALGAALSATATAAAAQGFPATPPRLPAAPSVKVPAPVKRTLANGMTVLYVRQPELPVVHATLVTRGGTSDDPAELPGLASFVASALDEGAAGRNALQIADQLDLLGASLSTGAGIDAAQANLYVLKKNFPTALGIMADVVQRPDFPEAEIRRLRQERLTNLQRARDEAGAIAGNAYPALVFGAQHPYGRFATQEGTRTLERDRVAAFHRAFYRPDATTLVLVGDVEPASLHAAVERAFGGWRAPAGAPLAPAAAPAAPTVGRTTIYLIDKPGAAQSELRIGHPGVARSSPDYFPLMVLNTLLGGSFTSRLNTNIREVHGYSYGAGSSFSMRRGVGPFTAASAVATAKTDSALIEFFKELRRVRDEPVPQDELDRAKRYLALGFPQNFETASQVAGQLAGLVTYDIDPSWLDTYVARVMAVTPADVARVAREYVRPDAAVVVVVGDRSKVEAAIRATNLAPVEIRELGEFVK